MDNPIVKMSKERFDKIERFLMSIQSQVDIIHNELLAAVEEGEKETEAELEGRRVDAGVDENGKLIGRGV